MVCSDCPRFCGVDRAKQHGFCRMGELPVVARAALHYWEEPPISGSSGSGAVFFSGCNMQCVYCQNREISRGGKGKEVTVDRLREIYGELIAQGAHNINLVTGSHFVRPIAQSLSPALPVPVVWNCGEKTPSDMAPNDWRRYVCVEPVSDWPGGRTLAPGESYELEMAIQTSLKQEGQQ